MSEPKMSLETFSKLIESQSDEFRVPTPPIVFRSFKQNALRYGDTPEKRILDLMIQDIGENPEDPNFSRWLSHTPPANPERK